MTGHEPNDLAPGRLAGADPRRRVLEHEELLVVAGEPEALASEAVARRVGLADGDGLGGDEVGWGGEVEDFEPLGGGVSFWGGVKGGRGGGGLTPVTSGTVPEVTIAQGAEASMREVRRGRAPGISMASEE